MFNVFFAKQDIIDVRNRPRGYKIYCIEIIVYATSIRTPDIKGPC